MWNFKLDNTTYKLYAIAHYEQPEFRTWNEFFNDLKIIKNIPKMFNVRRKHRSMVDIFHFVSELKRKFKLKSLGRLLLLQTKDEYISDIKTLLLFIDCLPNDIPEIDLNKYSLNFTVMRELHDITGIII